MADYDIIFEDNTVKVLAKIEDALDKFLLEAGAELESQVVRNTRVDTTQTKSKWAAKLDKPNKQIIVGNPLENAVWEEFGTGEFAENGNGRKGGWAYVDEKGNGHFTRGKKGTRAFWKAYISMKNKIIKRLQDSLKGL